nr:hypothetical protein CFP56_10035 [Quercus suber]
MRSSPIASSGWQQTSRSPFSRGAVLPSSHLLLADHGLTSSFSLRQDHEAFQQGGLTFRLVEEIPPALMMESDLPCHENSHVHIICYDEMSQSLTCDMNDALKTNPLEPSKEHREDPDTALIPHRFTITMTSSPEDQVRSWGFPSVFTWTDRPNAHYPPHRHAGLTTHLILAGALTITYPDDATPRKKTFCAGGRVDVEARRRHEVWIGEEGCTHGQRVHDTGAAIHHHIRTRDITTEATRQESGDSGNLRRQTRSLQPDDLLPRVFTLQIAGRELRGKSSPIKTLKIDSDVDLSWRDAVDAYAGALERGHACAHNSQRGVRGHVPLRGGLGHGGRGVFKREERRHAVRLEASRQVARCGFGDGGWAEEAGAGDVDVQTSIAVEDVVDELERVFFVGEIKRAADDLGGRILCVDLRGQGAVIIGWRGGTCVDDGGAVGC